MSGHYQVMAVYTRPHPLDPPTLKEPIDKAREYGPGAHIRISPATLAAVKDMDAGPPQNSYRPPGWLDPMATFGTPVVVHEDVPDDEWQVAVWQIGVEE